MRDRGQGHREELGLLWGKPVTSIDVPVRLLAGGIYAKHVYMFANHVCMFAELVCMYVCMYVCQAGMYVCQACMYVWEKNRALETRSDSLRKPFSI